MRNSVRPRANVHDSAAPSTDRERSLLREICRAKLAHAAWSKVASALSDYVWLDVEHGLVYSAIERLGAGDPRLLREQLPAQATRMGFPDIDWEVYFAVKEKRSTAAAPSRLLRLIRQLR